MLRNKETFILSDEDGFKKKLFAWAGNEPVWCFLDTCEQPVAAGEMCYRWLAASGIKASLHTDMDCLESLQAFADEHKDWMFGGFCYDIKNEIEKLSSSHPLQVKFPSLFFFVPEHVFLCSTAGQVDILSSGESGKIFDQVNACSAYVPVKPAITGPAVSLQENFSRGEYISTVKQVQQHILEGDVYELNLCMEFSATGVNPDPASLFLELSRYSPAPFSAFFRWHHQYLLSASPERFLLKQGKRLVSQPIKGTIKRGVDAAEDVLLQEQLRNSEKERAENVMIVDLVRNDLSRSCVPGSVEVDELFGIYAYPAVHQMVSTISGLMDRDISFSACIRNAFPMGSMTGAPKVMAMQLIEKYEKAQRGLYSGSIGYINPEQDFDFNVVIRSLFLDTKQQQLNLQVGSAITWDADPGYEYEECLLKARALKNVLQRFGIK